ncbi:uncharacterized protein LOC135216738 [Macrobrachium nipponense]|uniref:uncharacterized protein LOC135216738 n=1 Tax=Macrobrachium nipponense TaxID=159736 RepID=UPI0030C7FF7E
MDSESYLLKIIRSGSKSTADSLYLQTTIGKGIRWPIALLISTVVTVLAVVLCLVWRYIRGPATSRQATRFDHYIDDPQVIVSSSSAPEESKIKTLGPNQLLTSSVFLKNSPGTYNPRRSKSEQDLAWVKDDLFFPKRKVSWAPSNSVQHVRGVTKKKRRRRRHSEVTSCLSPIDFPEAHWSFSVSSLSTVINSSSNDVAVESDAAIIKVNRPSQLHLQISKTIAVLDDLNKSLQENHASNSDTPSPLTGGPVTSTPVPIPHDKSKRMRHHYKFFKPLVKNSELNYARSPSSLDAKTFDELEHLLDEPF